LNCIVNNIAKCVIVEYLGKLKSPKWK